MGHTMPGKQAAALGARRLDLLSAMSEGLASVQAFSLALQQATAEMGGLGGLAHWRDPRSGRLLLVTVCGLAPRHSDLWAVLSESDSAAPALAVHRSGIVWVPDDGSSGVAAVPLLKDGGSVGALSVITAGQVEPNAAQRGFLRGVAEWASRHIERDVAPAVDCGGEAALAMVRTLSDAFLTVDSRWRITYADEEAERLLASGVPLLGDVVDAVGYDQAFLRQIDRIPVSVRSAATDVLRTRTPRFVESPAEFVRVYPEVKYLVASSPKKAWAFLPLIASGHSIGCCVVSFSRPHAFSEDERVLLTALSGLVGQALERARLYDAEHSRAQELQRGLLPRSLPSLPAASAAARYLPAGRGDEVGGDWYDMILCPPGASPWSSAT